MNQEISLKCFNSIRGSKKKDQKKFKSYYSNFIDNQYIQVNNRSSTSSLSNHNTPMHLTEQRVF